MADPDRWIATALGIARHLAETATFHDGRCNWMGTTQDEDDDGELEFSYVTLGPDLYGGTSGIALFLAEAWRREPDATLRAAAEGGTRHALHHAAALGADRTGFFSGVAGIGWAAARVGALLDVPEFGRAAGDLLSRAHGAGDAPGRTDVIDGAAGEIPALLALERGLGGGTGAALRSEAVRRGDALLAAAARHPDGTWSWPSPDDPAAEPHLTGFAHGAAGIAAALLELHAATREMRFRDAAAAAFRYENRWFRAGEDNWPDFRGGEAPDDPAPCGAAWCHGAPGIGLARVRAVELVPDDEWRRDARAAVRTSMRIVRAQAEEADADWSLCHGLAGVCEFLLRASSVLEEPSARDAALACAAAAAERFSASPGLWPPGVARGPNPSLMLGAAGTGHFFLRLADPSIPSPLLPAAR